MYLLFNLVRIKASTCFKHYLLILSRHYANVMRVMSVGCTWIEVKLFHFGPWMDGWMDGRAGGRVDGRTDGWTFEFTKVYGGSRQSCG
jgi:hypothetical protein